MKSHRTIPFLALGALLLAVPFLQSSEEPAERPREKSLLAKIGIGQESKPQPPPQKAPQSSKPVDAAAKITGHTVWPAADVKWTPMEGIEGAKQAPLWGDPTKEAHGILYQWPAGTKVPLHTHTFGDRGVVVSGTLTLAVEGAPAKKLPAGSYFAMAGGTKHETGCEEGAPCVFFILREGLFDVKMVEAGAPKK